jgi:holo-[acyl-carrier protein] synthase
VTARPAGLAGDPGDRAARDLATRAAGEWSGGESDGRGIVGVGIDAVDLDRFATVLARRPRLAVRLFSGAERAYAATAPDPVPRLAARFAAKEAVMKALGTGLGGFALTEVEVRRGTGRGATAGAPSLVLHGSAAALAARCQAGRFHLSLTHTTEVAVAFVVAERSVPCSLS